MGLLISVCAAPLAAAQQCPDLSISISGGGETVVGTGVPISWQISGGFIPFCGGVFVGNWSALISWSSNTGWGGSECVGFVPVGDSSPLPTSGVYQWVPVAPGAYQLSGVVQCCYGCGVVSNSIAISVGCPPTAISLEWPAGGVHLFSGASSAISWTNIGAVGSQITLEYRIVGEGAWHTIASDITNTGTYPSWNVPTVTGSASQFQLRLSTSNTCTGQALVSVSEAPFSIDPAIDDGIPCTADIYFPTSGLIVHPDVCGDCNDETPCVIPGFVCVNGHCQPTVGLCPPKPCQFTYLDALGQCRELPVCGFGQCCVDGACVDAQGGDCAPPDIYSLTDDLITNATWILLGGVVIPPVPPAPAFLKLIPNSPAAGTTIVTMPPQSTFIAFEYHLASPSGGETAALSFGNRPLFVSAAATPAQEWTREYSYVGDLVGQTDALTFALVPSASPMEGDRLLVRNVKIYGPGGQFFCPGDLDGSGEVDGADLGAVLLNFGSCPGRPEDLDGSGEVDGADLGVVLLNFGRCGG